MAELNLKYFDGNNYYSDGDIENVILDMVKKGKDYSEMIGTSQLYPVMYHLSTERQNILNWYPFKKSDEILEVGAGCGALTGLLCRLAGHVTSNELSRRRSEINYERNKNCENLEIIVGNLNEVKFDRKFDYVILNGVFEYAMSFTEGENPYVKFLNEIKGKLKASGKILIAIENRLGIKYFAGAMEDHTNDYFVGLNNYEGNNTVRTFSKKELEHIFRQCGITKWKFYYPYPDYKFPTEIFTDENVNGGSYGKLYRNYQKDRVNFFSEYNMVSTLKNEEIMDVFSNSFLVELIVGELPESNVAYAKMNATRKEEYCISTVITGNESGYHVQKIPLETKAVKHIERTYQNQFKPLPKGFEYLQGELKDGVIQYPYLKEDTVDALLQKYMLEKDIEAILAVIDKICKAFLQISETREDYGNSEFKRYFGEGEGPKEQECIKDCNIDIIFDNLYLKDGKCIVIDSEWVVDGWVPTKFIIWRMLNEWYSKYGWADEMLPRREVHARCGISEKEANVYRSWAVYFANEFVSARDMDRCVSHMKNVDIRECVRQSNAKNTVISTLFVDDGNGFTEANKKEIELELQGNSFYSKILLDSSTNIKALRWDPLDFEGCHCKIEKCLLDGKEIEARPLNAEAEDSSLFLTMDPQYQLVFEPGCYEVLELQGELQVMTAAEYLNVIEKDKGQLHVLANELAVEKQQLADAQDRIRDNQQHLNVLEAENRVFRVENSVLTSRNGELKQQYEKLQDEKKELLQNKKNLQSDIDSLKEAQEQLTADKERLCSEKEHLLTEKENLNFQNSQLRTQNEELEVQVSLLNAELAMIKRSKFWKLLVKYWGLKGKR